MAIEKHYKMGEVSNLLQLTDETIIKNIHAGKLTAAKFGKDWRFPESGLAAFIESRTIKAKTKKTA